jgi:uncharacterized membrane protein
MTDERLENLIGNILRFGVLTAAVVVAAGGIFFLVEHHADPVHYRTFRLESVRFRELSDIVRSSFQLDPAAIIQLGLVVLIATPIARVALASIGFYLERDRLYVFVSLVVLSVLVFSLMHSA